MRRLIGEERCALIMPDLTVEAISPGLLELIGLPREAVVGQPGLQRLHKDQRQHARDMIKGVFSTGKPASAVQKILSVDGTTFYARGDFSILRTAGNRDRVLARHHVIEVTAGSGRSAAVEAAEYVHDLASQLKRVAAQAGLIGLSISMDDVISQASDAAAWLEFSSNPILDS